MIRYQIFENDVTTVGGIVQRHTGSGQTFIWHGRLASNIGDKINCPACGSVGYIAPKGMRRPVDNMKQAPALNGDLCICKCDPPPELKHSQDTCRQNVSGGIVIDVPKNPLNFGVPSLQQNLNNSFTDNRKFENYYIEQYKTDIFIQHKAVINPSETGSRGVSLFQMFTGAVSYFLNYKISGNELFISVSINAHPLSNDAQVFPFGNVTVSRDGKDLKKETLKKDAGFWNTSDNKAPVGSCTIHLPPANLSPVTVLLNLGYTARYNGTVGSVVPSPATKPYKFTITSMARQG